MVNVAMTTHYNLALCNSLPKHRKRCYIFAHFSSTPTRSWTWLYHQKANQTTFPMIYCPYGNILNLSRTSQIQYIIPLIQTNGTECTQTQTHRRENIISASFTLFTWWI